MIREVGARGTRHLHHLDHVFGLGEVSRLVVEARRHAPRARLQTGSDEVAHARDFVRGWTPVVEADHLGPHAVEADVGAHVHGQAARHGRRQLLADVERAGAIGIENLGRDALREHVRGRHEPVGGGVAVNVDEAGGHKQPRGIDLGDGAGTGQIADPRDGPAGDADVSLVARRPGAVDDRSMTDDDVIRRGRLGPAGRSGRRGHEGRRHESQRAGALHAPGL